MADAEDIVAGADARPSKPRSGGFKWKKKDAGIERNRDGKEPRGREQDGDRHRKRARERDVTELDERPRKLSRDRVDAPSRGDARHEDSGGRGDEERVRRSDTSWRRSRSRSRSPRRERWNDRQDRDQGRERDRDRNWDRPRRNRDADEDDSYRNQHDRSREHPRGDKPKQSTKSDLPPSRPAPPAEQMIVVHVNDRLGTKSAIPCLPSDTIGLFKQQVAAMTGRKPHEIMLKRQGLRPFKDHITLADYEISDGVQIDLEMDTGD